MSTIYGVSPDIQVDNSYYSNGGIALFNADGDHTITGGSGENEGEAQTSARIKWSITVDENNQYVTGGITGSNDWMRDTEYSPFTDYTDQDLAGYALRDDNLNEVFLAWNSKYNPGQVFTFMASAYNAHPGCVTGFAG